MKIFRYWNRFLIVSASVGALVLITASLAAAQGGAAGNTPPAFVFPVGPAVPAAKDDGTPKHLPGSTAAFTQTQVRDAFNVADWHPETHPAMPDVVAHGRKPDVRGCGYCHLSNGQGRPENAGLAGLPAAYIQQQIADWRNGLRKTSEPKFSSGMSMAALGKNTSEAEAKAAGEYFASIPFKQWIRVVETKTVPKTSVAGGMLVVEPGGATEPIGARVIETPENLERTELRDPTSSFVAYVPVGSIKKGETLVTKGGAGKTIRCGICHGEDLKGLAQVPPLAGRSPSYLIRQLYDFQNGSRKGAWSGLMKDVVSKLTVGDMVSIASYTASRKP